MPAPTKLMMARQPFVYTLDGLWHLVATVLPIVEASQATTNLLSSLMSELPADVRTKVGHELTTFTDALSRVLESAEGDPEPTGGGTQSTQVGTISEITGLLLLRVMRQSLRPKTGELICRSVLPIAVSAFEALIREIISTTFEKFPTLLGKETAFTLEALSRFESLQDAIDEAVETRVDNIVAGGVADWCAWLSRDPLGIQVQKLTQEWATTLEIFSRRHLVIHTGRKVTKRYLSQLEGVISDPPPVGSVLPIDVAYVSRAIDQLLVLGDLLWAFAVRKLNLADQEAIVGELHFDVESLLNDGRWTAAYGIADMAKGFKDQKALTQVSFRLATILAKKQLGDAEAVRPELDEFDVSSLNHDLRAQYHCIAGDHDAARLELRAAILAGETTLDVVRLSPRYAGLDLTTMGDGRSAEEPRSG